MLRNSVKMQDDNDNEQTQITTTQNVAIERKNSRKEKKKFSKIDFEMLFFHSVHLQTFILF